MSADDEPMITLQLKCNLTGGQVPERSRVDGGFMEDPKSII